MSVSDARRAKYDKARERFDAARNALDKMLDEDGHDRTCSLRCADDRRGLECSASFSHSCRVCGDDE